MLFPIFFQSCGFWSSSSIFYFYIVGRSYRINIHVILLFILFPCVCGVCVCMHSHVCVCVYVVCTYVWRSKVNIYCFPQLLSTVCFGKVSLPGPGVHLFCYAGELEPASSSLHLPRVGFKVDSPAPGLLQRGWRWSSLPHACAANILPMKPTSYF